MLSWTADGSVVAECAGYRMLFHKEGGFACRELYVPAVSTCTLTRFDHPGEGKHPTCMYFDNLNVNEVFQQAFYGKRNDSVACDVSGSKLALSGKLIPNRDGVRGTVTFSKLHRFDEEGYSVEVRLDLSEINAARYIGVFWDVNDRWPRWMRRSGAALAPLTVGVGDSFGTGLAGSFELFRDMGRRPDGTTREVFMEVAGQAEGLRVTLLSPAPDSAALAHGGMKMWDGPDDDAEGFGVSHNCINLDIVNPALAGRQGFTDPQKTAFDYRVDILHEERYRLFGNLEAGR